MQSLFLGINTRQALVKAPLFQPTLLTARAIIGLSWIQNNFLPAGEHILTSIFLF